MFLPHIICTHHRLLQISDYSNLIEQIPKKEYPKLDLSIGFHQSYILTGLPYKDTNVFDWLNLEQYVSSNISLVSFKNNKYSYTYKGVEYSFEDKIPWAYESYYLRRGFYVTEDLGFYIVNTPTTKYLISELQCSCDEFLLSYSCIHLSLVKVYKQNRGDLYVI